MKHDIPASKRFFRIGEASRITGVKPHVLRYWENEFGIISPEKARSSHRIYDRDDLILIMEIKRLLSQEKFTIEGARKRIKELRREKNKSNVDSLSREPLISDIKSELEQIRSLLTDDIGA